VGKLGGGSGKWDLGLRKRGKSIKKKHSSSGEVGAKPEGNPPLLASMQKGIGQIMRKRREGEIWKIELPERNCGRKRRSLT